MKRDPGAAATILDLLYRALHSKYGIVVETNNLENLRQRLYKVRRESEDPDLAALTLRPSPTDPETQLWIIRSDAQIPEETHPPSA